MAEVPSPSPKFAHRVEYAAFAATRAIFRQFSLDRGADLAGAFARPLAPLVRKRAIRNMRLALPDLSDSDHRRIASGMIDHLVRVMIEYMHLPELRDDPARIALHGAEHLEQARAAGRGAILVTGPFGNWEAVRAACARLDWTPAIIYRKFNTLRIDDEAMRYISSLDAPVFHKGKRGTLGLLRHVRKGGAVMILSDQRFSSAPHVPFFGIPARTSLAPAELAQQYGAALLPVRGVRRGRSSAFDVTIDPPIDVASGESAPVDAMREVNSRLESWIRETPEQYFWLHNRWGKQALNR